MASAISMPGSSFCLSSLSQSSNTRKQSLCSISNSISAVSSTQISNFEFSKWVPQLGFCQFSQWNGLKNLRISTPQLHVKIERMERYNKGKGKGVYASLFGVGAPEALVIGVVALLVFGPKGLAEVARNLGKTLRAFQPTIRELQDVSREFKSTLEREIGLDEIQPSNQNIYNSSINRNASRPSQNSSSETSQKEEIDPNGSVSPSKAYSTEDYLKITEEQLKAASASQQQSESAASSPGERPVEIQTGFQDAPEQAASTSAMPLPGKTENEK